MNSELGFAIIGVGNIADFHAKAISEIQGVKLRCVYSRSKDKTTAFASRYQIDAETDFDAVLKRKDIDIVCITTPSGAHAECAIPALQSGKHVLCEKPLDITLDRVDQMIAEAKKQKRILAAIFQSRFGHGAQTLKKAISTGRFGKLTLCDAYIKWWRANDYYTSGAWRGTRKLDGGGALMNQGIHAVDMLQWLVGMPIEVSAKTATLVHSKIEVEDTAVAVLRFSHGALGTITAATSAWPGFSKRIEISGDKGSVILEDDRLSFWKFENELPEDAAIRKANQNSQIGGGAADPKAISTEGHRRQMQDLVDAIREGRPPAISGEEGRNALQLILAIYESAKSGKTVKL